MDSSTFTLRLAAFLVFDDFLKGGGKGGGIG